MIWKDWIVLIILSWKHLSRQDKRRTTQILPRQFKISPDEGKHLLHELMNTELGAAWLHPNTDFIVTFGPFNNLPTQYRITVDGRQKWFTP